MVYLKYQLALFFINNLKLFQDVECYSTTNYKEKKKNNNR
jgi:hypothetical protein